MPSYEIYLNSPHALHSLPGESLVWKFSVLALSEVI